MMKKQNLTMADASHKYAMLAKASKKAGKLRKTMSVDLSQMETVGERFAYIMEIRHFIKSKLISINNKV